MLILGATALKSLRVSFSCLLMLLLVRLGTMSILIQGESELLIREEQLRQEELQPGDPRAKVPNQFRLRFRLKIGFAIPFIHNVSPRDFQVLLYGARILSIEYRLMKVTADSSRVSGGGFAIAVHVRHEAFRQELT